MSSPPRLAGERKPSIAHCTHAAHRVSPSSFWWPRGGCETAGARQDGNERHAEQLHPSAEGAAEKDGVGRRPVDGGGGVGRSCPRADGVWAVPEDVCVHELPPGLLLQVLFVLRHAADVISRIYNDTPRKFMPGFE